MPLPSHVPLWASVTNSGADCGTGLIIRLLRKIQRGPCGAVATWGQGGAGLGGTWAGGVASRGRRAPPRTPAGVQT